MKNSLKDYTKLSLMLWLCHQKLFVPIFILADDAVYVTMNREKNKIDMRVYGTRRRII